MPQACSQDGHPFFSQSNHLNQDEPSKKSWFLVVFYHHWIAYRMQLIHSRGQVVQ
jgi:hypothetical protein